MWSHLRLFSLLALLASTWALPARSEQRLRVVATLSTFADIAREVGGERVEVSAVASPRFNPHFIEPKPSDVLRLKRADLFIHGGLDLEAWRRPLVDAVGRPEMRDGGERALDLSRGVELLNVPRSLSRAEGDVHQFGNPHYWLSPENGRVMAGALAAKLTEIDPAGRELYGARASAFVSALDEAIKRWRSLLEPLAGSELVGYHDEWVYLMRFAGLRMELFLEPKPGIAPSPQHLQALQEQIRARRIPAIAQATFYPRGAADAVSAATGARVMLLCQGAGELPECEGYIAMLDHNVRLLVDALKPMSGRVKGSG